MPIYLRPEKRLKGLREKLTGHVSETKEDMYVIEV